MKDPYPYKTSFDPFLDDYAFSENRLKILRFLFGGQLPEFPQEPLLQFFDQYAKAGEVRINTCHYLYSIKGGPW